MEKQYAEYQMKLKKRKIRLAIYRTMLYSRQSRNPDIVTKCSPVVIISQNNMQAAQEKKGEIILQIMIFLKCIFELILSL